MSEWNYKLYNNGELDMDPCTNCGKGGFINANLSVGAQYAKKGDKGDCDIDDMWFEEVNFARCNHCQTILKE